MTFVLTTAVPLSNVSVLRASAAIPKSPQSWRESICWSSAEVSAHLSAASLALAMAIALLLQ